MTKTYNGRPRYWRAFGLRRGWGGDGRPRLLLWRRITTPNFDAVKFVAGVRIPRFLEIK